MTDERFEMVSYAQKEELETNPQLPEDKDDYAYLRAVALVRLGEVLGYTDVNDTATKESATRLPQPEDQRYSIWI